MPRPYKHEAYSRRGSIHRTLFATHQITRYVTHVAKPKQQNSFLLKPPMRGVLLAIQPCNNVFLTECAE